MRVLLFVVLCTGVLGDIASNCDPLKFQKCQETFSNDLKIDVSYNWKDPVGLGVQIQNLYITGITGSEDPGIVSVCTAYNAFLDCLSDSAFTAFECFDPMFLIHADSTPIAAYQYAFLMSMQQYQCGSGFYPSVEGWSCLQKVYQSQNATIQGCFRTFQINAAIDALNTCKYIQDGMDCMRRTTLQCSSTLQYFACESFRQYTMPAYQAACKQQCYV